MARDYDEDDEREDEDDEEEDDGEDEEEDYEERTTKRKRGSEFIDDAAEEDDDEDEEEAPQKKRGGGSGYSRSMFIDDVAAVASDDEEEEEEEEEGFIDRDVEIPDEAMERGPRPLLPRDEEKEMNVEEYERMIEERYAHVGEGVSLDEGEVTDVEQQALLPSVRDPKLWIIKCIKPGHEREAVVSLMQKCVDLAARGKPLQIKSAVALDNLKGFIYVEADKEAHVKEACAGMRLLSMWKASIVPINEMAGVLTVRHKASDLDVGSWVRVKMGVYKGDLAQVVELDSVRQRATVKLVPRIDLQALAQRQNGEPVVQRKGRPPPRLFNVDEAKNHGIRPSIARHRGTGEHVHTIGDLDFVGGYLHKRVSLKSLDHHAVMPSLDELQRFNQKAGGDDSLADDVAGGVAAGLMGAMGLNGQQRPKLVKGDVVEVMEGDLKGLQGVVEKVEEDEVIIRPRHKELKDPLPVKQSQLRKYFATGDHVKVVVGKHDGETGMVVKVEGNVAVIFSDTMQEHVKVFTRDLVSTSEVSAGPSQIGEYELHDLVLLDHANAGMIVKVEKTGCIVLKATPERSDTQAVRLPDIRRKLQSKTATAQDSVGNPIAAGDPVRVLHGVHKDKRGTVAHIFRGVLFLHDRNYHANGGFFAVRARSCAGVGGAGRTASGPGGHSLNGPPGALTYPAGPQADNRFNSLRSPSHMLQSPRNFQGSPMRQGGRGGPGAYGGGRMGMRRENGLVGRMIKIRAGPFKGYRGRVIDATDTTARVELESQMKVVTVRRDQLPDGSSAQPSAVLRGSESPWGRGGAGGAMGSETPIHPSRTPMHPGFTPSRSDPTATPMHEGMRTPMRDPAWNPQVPTTPIRPSSWDDTNPSTWGGPSSSDSAYLPFTPSFSPADMAPSPVETPNVLTPGGASGAFDLPTPGDLPSPYDFPTPSSQLMTPGTAYVATTPGGGYPLTPADGNPASPAIGGGHGSARGSANLSSGDASVLGLPGVAVTVPGRDREFGSSTIVIREVLPDGSFRVGPRRADESELIVVPSGSFKLVPPETGERVKILRGSKRGATGWLRSLSGSEAVVEVEGEREDVVIGRDGIGLMV